MICCICYEGVGPNFVCRECVEGIVCVNCMIRLLNTSGALCCPICMNEGNPTWYLPNTILMPGIRWKRCKRLMENMLTTCMGGLSMVLFAFMMGAVIKSRNNLCIVSCEGKSEMVSIFDTILYGSMIVLILVGVSLGAMCMISVLNTIYVRCRNE